MADRIAIGLAITAIGLALVIWRALFLFRLVSSGKPAPGRMKDVAAQLKAEILDVFGQRKLLKRPSSGVAHFFVFWGFIVLIFTIIEAYGDLFSKTFAIPLIGHDLWLGFLEDFFATAVLVALCTFTVIRIRQAPDRRQRASRFYGSHTTAAWITLFLIFCVIATLLIYRGAQINTGDFPYGDTWWTFASKAVSIPLAHLSQSANMAIETTFILLQILVIWAFFVFVLHSKHMHIFVSEPNVLFSRRPNALGPLATTPDLENMGDEDVLGTGVMADLTWKQRLDLISCTECGRCQDQCPAWVTDKPLSPKLLIMALREHMFESAPDLLSGGEIPEGAIAAKALVPDVIDPDVLWACTTCGNCVEQCPVDIEHVDTILDMRRYEVLMESRFPTEAATMLRNIENQGDPWGLGTGQRLLWTDGLDFEIPVVTGNIPDDVEYLFWVGCAGALDERARTDDTDHRPPSAPGGSEVRGARVRRSPAPETPPAAWATSTCTRCRHRPTSRPCNRPGFARSWLPARTASTPSPANTPPSEETSRCTTTPRSSRSSSRRAPCGRPTGWSPRSPTTTPATWAGTTRSTTSPAASSSTCPEWSSPRCTGAGKRASAAEQGERGCGWRRTSAHGSTCTAQTKLWVPEPT